mmetsp:Transcript_14207/g.61872  ORF Transcript_14207/g.61872 Transcript_14207/m.61872 type:complete len:202 (-) Transcript_14207:887-1492(-)
MMSSSEPIACHVRSTPTSPSSSIIRVPSSFDGSKSSRVSHPSGVTSGCLSSQSRTICLTTQFVVSFVVLRARRVRGSLAPLRSKCNRIACLSYVCPESNTITGSRNMVRVMEHKSSSGSTTRSASGAERSRSARGGCGSRASAVAYPDAVGDELDVFCRLAGAIERASFRGLPCLRARLWSCHRKRGNFLGRLQQHQLQER